MSEASSKAVTVQERHAIEHMRYLTVRATPENSEVRFDYGVTTTVLRVIDRLLQDRAPGQGEEERIRWQRVNDDGFDYAIQQGPHGDEFVKLLDGSCLRRSRAHSTAVGKVVEALKDFLYQHRSDANDRACRSCGCEYCRNGEAALSALGDGR